MGNERSDDVRCNHKRLTASGKLALSGGDSEDAAVGIAGIQLVAAGDTATVIGYKVGAATAGKEFIKLTALLNTEKEFVFPEPVQGEGGWYFALTGTTPVLHVFYRG